MQTRQMRLYKWEGPIPLVGDLLTSRGGTRYRVLASRPSRAGSKSRAVLHMLKLEAGEDASLSSGQRHHSFHWLPRG